MTRLLPELPKGSPVVTAEQLASIYKVSFGVLRGLLSGISVPCMGHPWVVPDLKHLAVIVVSQCHQFSPAWAAMFRCPGDSSCRLFIAWVKIF